MHANGEKARRQASHSSSADQKASEIERDMKERLILITSQAERVLCVSTCKQEVQNDLTVLYQQILWWVTLNSLAISDLLVEGPVTAEQLQNLELEVQTSGALRGSELERWLLPLPLLSSENKHDSHVFSWCDWASGAVPLKPLADRAMCACDVSLPSPNWLLEGQRCTLFIDPEQSECFSKECNVL